MFQYLYHDDDGVQVKHMCELVSRQPPTVLLSSIDPD